MGCRDIYMSSINNRLNRIMKTLAIISVVTLPLTVITSFFGMNFADTIPGFYQAVHVRCGNAADDLSPIRFSISFSQEGLAFEGLCLRSEYSSSN